VFVGPEPARVGEARLQVLTCGVSEDVLTTGISCGISWAFQRG